MIAYRLQAERLGDLDRDTQRFLDRVAVGTRKGDELPHRSTVAWGRARSSSHLPHCSDQVARIRLD
jgi:hypothetical protein